ncbi:hypothetical protein CVE28_22225, partial [Pseudomonas syringae pv. actinidiae]|nr:hypothetical protein [Pseudomonas syringae pv. actinidiae]
MESRSEYSSRCCDCLPTEAVWGLGCDPWDEEAVYRLLAIKSRPVEKGLILIAEQH